MEVGLEWEVDVIVWTWGGAGYFSNGVSIFFIVVCIGTFSVSRLQYTRP